MCERRAPVRPQRVRLLSLLQQGRFDACGLGRQRRTLAHARGRLAQAPVEIVERRLERAELLLQQRGGEEGVADFLPEREQLRPHAGLRFGEIGAGQVAPRLNARIVQALVDTQRRVVGELRRGEHGPAVGAVERRRGHIGLIL